MSAAKYWQTLGVNLKDKTLSLEQQYNNRKIEVEKDLKSLYTEVNLQKNEVKDLRSNYDKTSQEYKDLTIVFKQLQVSESAGMEASGDGKMDYKAWQEYIDWMEQRGLSWIVWSISDKDETCSMLKKSANSEGNWKNEDLKESGLKTREYLRFYNK